MPQGLHAIRAEGIADSGKGDKRWRGNLDALVRAVGFWAKNVADYMVDDMRADLGWEVCPGDRHDEMLLLVEF